MEYEYFHAPEKPSLYKAPSNPTVTEEKYRKGWIEITKVSALIEGREFGRNNPKGGKDISYSARESYTSRDSREEAIQYFKFGRYPSAERITGKEYARLYLKYSG